MKTTLIAVSLFFTATCSYAQIPAVTNNGEEVVLYEDGTWKYVSGSEPSTPETNPTIFTKGSNATFSVKSKRAPVAIWLNPKKWSFEKGDGDEGAEYDFILKGEEARGMLLAEKIEIPMNSLREMAFENAKEAAPDIQVVKEEYRNVNGITVLCLQMKGTIQGIKFVYFGYYFSSESGTVQFITYTSQNLFASYQKEMEEFLNGFTLAE